MLNAREARRFIQTWSVLGISATLIACGSHELPWQEAEEVGELPQPLVATCGNNTLEGAETCDDGNLVNGDGCSFVCQKEDLRVVAGDAYTLLQRDDGSVWAWGSNSSGQLGDGTRADRLASAPVDLSKKMVKRVAAGGSHALALLSDKTLQSWGLNMSGQLGDGATTARWVPGQVQGLPVDAEVVAMDGSTQNSAAVLSNGKVFTWGDNDYGQLGNDSTINDSSTPVEVSALSEIKGVSTGKYHMLALRSGGTVWAWGENGSGQLGSGNNTDYKTPNQVVGLKGVASVSGGDYHSLALRWDGTVWAWGDNSNGQLGIGSFTSRTSPVQVPRLTGVVAVAAGGRHSLALRLDGTVWAWGYNGGGQLGDGTTLSRVSPVQVPGLTGVVSVAAGETHSVAVLSDGRVYAWGLNGEGQLGNGSRVAQAHPTPGQALLPFVCGNNRLEPEEQCDDGNSINGDGCSALCLAESGSSVCGDGIKSTAEACDDGNLVNGDGCGFTCRLETPRVVAGSNFTLFQKDNGTLWAWGQNSSGQLGDGSTVQRLTPVPVSSSSLTNVKNAAAGGVFALALRSDGTLWSWGANSLGQLGGSRTETGPGSRMSPGQVEGLSGVVAVAAGQTHSVVALSDGTVRAWGYNGYGQLGDKCLSTYYCTTPTAPSNLFSVRAVAAGQDHSLAVRSDGTVWAWGHNGSAQLGDGSIANRIRPVQVAGLKRVVAVAAGFNHSLALRSDGTVWAWGDNGSGQLGDDSFVGRLLPVEVKVPKLPSGESGVVAVAAGDRHSLALRSDGTLWAWGYNSNGQIGDGSSGANHPTPVKVAFSAQDVVMGVAAGETHSVAVLSDGKVFTWGRNHYGQLGYDTSDNTTSNNDRLTPREVTVQ